MFLALNLTPRHIKIKLKKREERLRDGWRESIAGKVLPYM